MHTTSSRYLLLSALTLGVSMTAFAEKKVHEKKYEKNLEAAQKNCSAETSRPEGKSESQTSDAGDSDEDKEGDDHKSDSHHHDKHEAVPESDSSDVGGAGEDDADVDAGASGEE